jgi:hypothetical protein
MHLGGETILPIASVSFSPPKRKVISRRDERERAIDVFTSFEGKKPSDF